MNSQDLYRTILKAYLNSSLPTAVVYHKSVEVNSEFKKLFCYTAPNELTLFLTELSENRGSCHKMFNGVFYTANVIEIEETIVIEITRSESIKSLVDMPTVRRYLIYVFSKLRLTVNSISVAANDIHAILSEKEAADKEITCNLNSINSSLLKIISLIIDPEQLIYLIGDTDNDSTVSLKDEISKITKDINTVFNGNSKVICDRNDIMFTRLNRLALRTLLVDAASQFKLKGYLPDTITISSEELSDGNARITLESDCSSKRSFKEYCEKNNIEMQDSILTDFFFEYICDVFCKRYSGSFEQKETADGYRFTVTVPIIKNMPLAVNAPDKFNSGIAHFDVARVRMMELMDNEVYKDN